MSIRRLINNKRALISALSFFTLLAVVVWGNGAHAVLDGGSGGNAGGGSTGPQVKYGYGWYKFPIANSGPSLGFKDTSVKWSNIQAKCSNLSADTIVTFIIFDNNSDYMGYNDNSSIGANSHRYDSTDPKVTGDNNFITRGDAKAYYDAALPGGKGGLTWGNNVAWFCYSFAPPAPVWTIAAESKITKITDSTGKSLSDTSKAKPGDTITWTHSVTNSGPDATDASVTFHHQDRQGLGGASGTEDKIFLSGQTNGANASFESTYKVTDADFDKNLCRATSNIPASSTVSGWNESAPACVSVPYNWSISTGINIESGVTSTGGLNTAGPGSIIKWKHTVTNQGPTKTNKDINYLYKDSDGLGTGTGGNGKLISGATSGNVATFYSEYTVKSSDVNKNLCRATSASPASVLNSGDVTPLAISCVFIPYKYGLTPTVTLDHSKAVDAGSSMTATAQVNNSGPTISKPSKWELTRIVVKPSKDVPHPTGGLDASSPCGTYFSSTFASCTTAGSGTGVTFNVGDNKLGDFPTEIEDVAIGTKICYALSVQPATDSNNNWNHSAPVCVTIGKKPKIQILGGDLWVGVPFSGSASVANVMTGTVTKKGATFGSWIEYGIFATGVVKGTGSGAAFAGQGQVGSTVCNYSVLSFTNADDSQCSDTKPIGSYATTKIMPDVEASFPSTSAIGNLGSNDLVGGNLKSGIYTTSVALTISGGNLSKGQWVVLSAPDADVTIDGNITYTSEKLGSVSDIPQLIIIAKNINVTDKVTQIDAWLIAKGAASSADGKINTCSSVAESAALTINVCNKQLVVNGPVMANKLYLRRTFGSDPCIGSDCKPSSIPAEIFNLRPDAFLWSTGRSVVSGRLQTVYTTELPPRL